MLRTKIKISQLTHLTDARYFAAWGVDYLGFDIDPDSPYFVSPKVVKDIAGWIEGPEIVIEVVKSDEILLKDFLDLVPGAIVESATVRSNGKTMLRMKNIEDLTWQENNKLGIYQPNDSWKDLNRKELGNYELSSLLIDTEFHIDDIDDILELGFAGLVLRGGEEESVGVKSYDDLDEIFDKLSV